ncbi:MAG: sigma-70 family RNA polymerase sigma factor [Chloroflexi bacterium]|nr:sigma-70 family RNA polymerase sigma factor [Chloroflexota bacterium]
MELESFSDHELLVRAGSGDDGAFAALYDRLAGPAYSLAYYILRDPQWAQDVVQEAFVNIWRVSGSYDTERGTVKTWALATVRNRSIDHLRRQNSRPVASVELTAETAATTPETVWDQVVRSLEAEVVHQALNTLPEEQRRVIEMAYFGGLSQQEIASDAGLPLGTVKSRMRLGLMKLREALAGESREVTP